MTNKEEKIQQTPASSEGLNWASTGSKVFLGLALVPPALMFLSSFAENAKWALAVGDHFPLLVCLTIAFSTVSGCLSVAHKFGSTGRSNCEESPEQGGP